MEKRIELNSESLKERFKNIYSGFFSKSVVSASSSGTIFLSGEHAASYGSPAVLQKLPVRVYIGLEPADQAGLFFSDIKYFIPSKQRFVTIPLFESTAQRICKVIPQNLYKSKNHKGLKVHILSEFPPGSGLNVSGALGSALSLALHTYKGTAKPKDLTNWQEKKINDLLLDEKFNNIFRLAWKIDCAIEASSSSGACTLASLVFANYPILYFSQKRRDKNGKRFKGIPPANVEKDYLVIDKLKCWGFKFEEFINTLNQDWPIDFGLIYSGDYHTTQTVVNAMNVKRQDLVRKNLELEQAILEKINIAQRNLTEFLNESANHKPVWLDSTIGTATEITLGTWWSLIRVFRSGSSFTDLDRFFAFINAFQRYLFLIEASAFKADKISLLIRNFIREANDELDAGAKITGAGWGSDILFAVQKTALIGRAQSLLNYLRKEVNNDIYLDYASWIDGIGNGGALIEQDIRNKKYSNFISQNTILTKILDKSANLLTKSLSASEFEKIRNENNIDIILDKPNSKIYINGEKMNSKIIKSSFTTIEILSTLINNMGKPVSSKHFPPSSYREDRNEYTSKIVYPIKYAVKKYLNKELPLEVKGSISEHYSTFYPGLSILLKEKVF